MSGYNPGMTWTPASFGMMFLASIVFGFGFAIGGSLWAGLLGLLRRG